jgi:HNH endonuclease
MPPMHSVQTPRWTPRTPLPGDDPETGLFTRLSTGSVFLGTRKSPVGSKESYRCVSVEGKRCKAHRVAWALITGEQPPDIIDHVNGDPADNKWANLRNATHQENGTNRNSAEARNKLGILGVHQMPNGRFRAMIKTEGRKQHIGVYDTAEEAHEAYLRTKADQHPMATVASLPRETAFDPVLTQLLSEGVPSSLATHLAETCLTRQALQRALMHWTGRCHLTNLKLQDEPPALAPVQRADGTFVCRGACELAGDLSDNALVQMCRLVVAADDQRQQRRDTQPPVHNHQQQAAHHDQVPRVELRDPEHWSEVSDGGGDASGTAEPSDGGRGGLGDQVDEWLRRYEGAALPADGRGGAEQQPAVELNHPSPQELRAANQELFA